MSTFDARLILLFCYVSLGMYGCNLQPIRVKKALSSREQVLDTTFSMGHALVDVQYRAGADEPKRLYEPEFDLKTGYQRPPELFSKSAIFLEVKPGVNPQNLKLQVFIKNDVHDAGGLSEVHTLVGEIPGYIANSVTFVEDLFPKQFQRLIIYPDDISGPYQGVSLKTHDWIVIKVSSPSTSQKIVFEYIKTGLRVDAGAQLMVSTGINLFDLGVAQLEVVEQSIGSSGNTPRKRAEVASEPGQVDIAQFNLALTFTVAFGYRSKTRSDTAHWLEDNLTLVFDVGVGNTGELQRGLSGGSVGERVGVLQNQLLFGGGLQFFDFISVHLVGNSLAIFPIPGVPNVESVLIPQVGVDVGTALQFSSRIYERIFTSTVRKSQGETPPAGSPSKSKAKLIGQSPSAQEGLALDESFEAPKN